MVAGPVCVVFKSLRPQSDAWCGQGTSAPCPFVAYPFTRLCLCRARHGRRDLCHLSRDRAY